MRSRTTLCVLPSDPLVRSTLSRSRSMMASQGFLTVLGSSRCPWRRTARPSFLLPDSSVGSGIVGSLKIVPFAGPPAIVLRSVPSMVCVVAVASPVMSREAVAVPGVVLSPSRVVRELQFPNPRLRLPLRLRLRLLVLRLPLPFQLRMLGFLLPMAMMSQT